MSALYRLGLHMFSKRLSISSGNNSLGFIGPLADVLSSIVLPDNNALHDFPFSLSAISAQAFPSHHHIQKLWVLTRLLPMASGRPHVYAFPWRDSDIQAAEHA